MEEAEPAPLGATEAPDNHGKGLVELEIPEKSVACRSYSVLSNVRHVQIRQSIPLQFFLVCGSRHFSQRYLRARLPVVVRFPWKKDWDIFDFSNKKRRLLKNVHLWYILVVSSGRVLYCEFVDIIFVLLSYLFRINLLLRFFDFLYNWELTTLL